MSFPAGMKRPDYFRPPPGSSEALMKQWRLLQNPGIVTDENKGFSLQVMTHAYNPVSQIEGDFPNPSSVPSNWIKGYPVNKETFRYAGNDTVRVNVAKDTLKDLLNTTKQAYSLTITDESPDAHHVSVFVLLVIFLIIVMVLK